MSRSTLDLWVGFFVAIGIAAILFLALKVGNLVAFGSTPGYRLDAAFDNIGGLKLRAPVKAAGVVVGRVEKVHPIRRAISGGDDEDDEGTISRRTRSPRC
jgi:phospholipid/cholesterol/gamma-HCH transport system substrate-binding protein